MKPWQPTCPIPQRDTPELLDSRSFSKAQVAQSLADVARINSFLGATKPLYDSVLAMIKEAGLKRATVLDVGSGNGDFARRLLREGAKHDVELQIVGLDISRLHLQIAREESRGRVHYLRHQDGKLHGRWELQDAPIEWVQGDIFALPLRDLSVDIVTSSLFLHHFRPEQIERILVECSRVARVGWAMNDCARDGYALAAFRVLRPYLGRSSITRFDALASIRRSYTPGEMREVVSVHRGATVRSLFPYRLQVEWKR